MYVYVCTGTCGGAVTEAQYQAGSKTCAAETCNKYGEPLEIRRQCESCETAAAKDGTPHNCPMCLTGRGD